MSTPDPAPRPRCFIAMPITTHPEEATRYGDPDHWKHIMEYLFVPAIEKSGFEAVRPVAKGSSMIHAEIVKNLEECEMVLCDLSGHNPNVIFELGVRTSLDKPIAIVRDEKTEIPFDLGGLNAYSYSSEIRPWTVDRNVPLVAEHIDHARETCAGNNPMWQQYGLTLRAEAPQADESPTDAKLDLLLGQLEQVRKQQQDVDARLSRRQWAPTVSSGEPGLTRVVDIDGFEKAMRAEPMLRINSILGLPRVNRLSPDSPFDVELVFSEEPQKSAVTIIERLAQNYGVNASFKVSPRTPFSL